MWFAISVLIFFLIVQTLLGLSSLRGGFSFLDFVRKKLDEDSVDHGLNVIVFVPCKGLEQGLEKNLRAISEQSVASRTMFIVEDESDPAVQVIEAISTGEKFVAGKAVDSGQKVHNLIEATKKFGKEADVIVFADSDARPRKNWLLDLIDPLFSNDATVATGYRWFVPETLSFASELRSAWNASITSSLGSETSSNFCWGGSMAIKSADFLRLGVADAWRGTVSDDFVLTNVVKAAGEKIEFVPSCLNPSLDSIGIGGFLEFAARQMTITKIYSPTHFRISLIGSALFVLTFFGGLLSVLALTGLPLLIVTALLLLIWIFGAAKSLIRYYAVSLCLPQQTSVFGCLGQLLLWPLATTCFLVADLMALSSNRIVWRGIGYNLVSDKEIEIFEVGS